MYTLLENYFGARTPIDIATQRHINDFFKPLKARRNEILLRPGEICNHYYFVNKGCLRLYALNEKGNEATRYFAFEGAFGTALPSLIQQNPAFEYIQTIEPSELLAITRIDFFMLVDTVPQMAHIYRLILELGFITAQKRIYGFQNLSSIAKLKWVMGYQPKLLSRVSNKMAASFLGIAPSTLSRLKAQL